MSRAWKWILGILGALLVIGLVVGAVFMWKGHTAWWGQRLTMPYGSNQPGSEQGPGIPYGHDGYRRYHMDDWAWRMPMLHSRGFLGPAAFTPFGFACMFAVGLIRLALPLGVLALVAYVFYQMGKRAGGASGTNASSASRRDVKPLPGRKVAGR